MEKISCSLLTIVSGEDEKGYPRIYIEGNRQDVDVSDQ